MLGYYHLFGGGPVLKKFKVGATCGPGTLVQYLTGAAAGLSPCAATAFTFCYGLALDTGTYTIVQGATEGIVTVSIRPDLVMKARMCGSATEGTSLTVATNTLASAGGTTVTSADIPAVDMDSGTCWCIAGNNVGESRIMTTHTASTSFVVTVPFPRAIAVGDQFLNVPWSTIGDGTANEEGNANVNLTTLLHEADGTIATGTGGEVTVVDMELREAADSYVCFLVSDNIFGTGSASL